MIAAKDKIDQASFALDQATKITQNYEKYFGVPYPLPKQGPIVCIQIYVYAEYLKESAGKLK